MSSIQVNNIKNANGTSAIAIDSSGVATFSKTLVPANPLTNRNLIINGDMRIAQRGTSSTGITSSSGAYYTIDRMGAWMTTAGTWTMSQDSDVPTGQGFANSMKWSCTTANASLSAGSYMHLTHNIEAQNLQHLKFGSSSAESITLSFWVKSNKTGTYVVEFYHDDASKALSKTYTIDTADTWEKKTITVTGNTNDVIVNDNGMGLQIWHWLVAGTNFSSGTANSTWTTRVIANDAPDLTVNLADSTSNYINITGVQLEVGDAATPFEHRPYDMELARCERYYQKNYLMEDAPGVSTSGENTRYMHGSSDGSSNGAAGVFWRCRMRATPTVTWYTDGGTQGQWDYARSGASGTATFTAYRVGDTGANGFLGVGAAWATCSLWGNWTANAEL